MHSKSRKTFRNRARFLGALFSLLAIMFVTRVYFLQVVYGEAYKMESDGQYVTDAPKFFDRGSIFFTNLDGTLFGGAVLQKGSVLSIEPNRIKNIENAYKNISNIIPIDEAEFISKASKTSDPYEEIKHRVDSEVGAKISKLNLSGVRADQERWRYYPGGTLAANTLGIIAYDGNEKKGIAGLESYFEDVLARNSSGLYTNSFAEIFSSIRSIVFTPIEKQEGDVITAIEPSVQLALEKEIVLISKKWHSSRVSGIIIDPKTGIIYGLATNPSYNPNDTAKYGKVDLRNPIVENVYEHGSIVKPLTIAAAIDLGVISSSTTYNDTASRTVDSRTIHNHDRKSHGVIDMQEVLSKSLNVGIAFIVEKMGKDNLRRYFTRYGLREETGIDLPSESSNLTNNLDSPRMVEYMTAGFGQGIAITPIAMARALSILPDGYIEDPHLAVAIKMKNGITRKIDKSDFREKVLKKETAEEITRMLVNVVDKALYGGKYKMQNYSIAAKTGTAQMSDVKGGYYDDRYLHTFFGYFPAYDPRFLVLLINEEPKGAFYANETLTEPFFNLAKYLINYYQIAPDR